MHSAPSSATRQVHPLTSTPTKHLERTTHLPALHTCTLCSVCSPHKAPSTAPWQVHGSSPSQHVGMVDVGVCVTECVRVGVREAVADVVAVTVLLEVEEGVGKGVFDGVSVKLRERERERVVDGT
eukprot:Sspe_Gene.21664::Locus_8136_Transcript_1_1_Confidence_1.000_Length_949::g.21664::m.21664